MNLYFFNFTSVIVDETNISHTVNLFEYYVTDIPGVCFKILNWSIFCILTAGGKKYFKNFSLNFIQFTGGATVDSRVAHHLLTSFTKKGLMIWCFISSHTCTSVILFSISSNHFSTKFGLGVPSKVGTWTLFIF